MTSKAERRRQKKLALPSIEPAPRKKARGKLRMSELAQLKNDPEAMHTVLDARARQMGKTAEKPADAAALRDEMRSPAYSGEAERAISSIHGGEARTRALEAHKGLISAYERYCAVFGKSPYPKCATIETAPERFETRADDRPDFRSEEERERDAKNRWQIWVTQVNLLSKADSRAIWDHVSRGSILRTPEGVTAKGRAFAQAVLNLADVGAAK